MGRGPVALPDEGWARSSRFGGIRLKAVDEHRPELPYPRAAVRPAPTGATRTLDSGRPCTYNRL